MCQQFADMICHLMNEALAIGLHRNNPHLANKINQALASMKPYLFIAVHNANVNPYGSITLAEIAKMSPKKLDEMIGCCDIQQWMTTLRASRDPKMVQSSAKQKK